MEAEPKTPTVPNGQENKSPFINFCKNKLISTSTPCSQTQSPAMTIFSSWKSRNCNNNLSPIKEIDSSDSGDSGNQTVIPSNKISHIDTNPNSKPTKSSALKESEVIVKIFESTVEDSSHSATIVYKDVDDKKFDEDGDVDLAVDECSIIFENKTVENNRKRDFQPIVELKETGESKVTVKAAKKTLKRLLNIDLVEPPKEDDQHLVKSKGFTEFVSNDEAENKDNNDPCWKNFEKMKKSGQICNAVELRWGCGSVPNPKENLTSYNWRNKNGLYKVPTFKRKIKFNAQRNYSKLKDGQFSVIFDEMIKDAFNNFREKYNSAEQKFQWDMLNLADKQQQDINGYVDVYGNYIPGYANMYNHHVKEVETLTNSFHDEIRELYRGYSDRVETLEAAINETKRIYQFYDGIQPSSSLNRVGNITHFEKKELRQWLEVEDMISSYHGIFYP